MAILVPARVPRVALHSALLVGCLVVLACQLRSVDFVTLFADVSVGWTALAVLALVVSLGAAAHNISAFAPIRVRVRDGLRAQLAVGGLRMIAPSAVSTPAIGTRLLARKGLPVATAVAVLAIAQSAQLVMTIVVVGALAVVASHSFDGSDLVVPVVALCVLAAVALVVARWVPAGRRLLHQAVGSVRSVGVHLRSHPRRVVTGLGASALLTLAHIGAFAACVHAVGGGVPVLELTAIYLAASSAGSLVPTPGGIGAVESAMLSGLVASGLSAQVATAGALLSRLITVWLPAIPGLWALRSLRRDGLV